MNITPEQLADDLENVVGAIEGNYSEFARVVDLAIDRIRATADYEQIKKEFSALESYHDRRERQKANDVEMHGQERE